MQAVPERPGGFSQKEGFNMVKYEYLPLSASGRDAEGADRIQSPAGQPGADPGGDAQVQLPPDGQPALPDEGDVTSGDGSTQAEDALCLLYTSRCV